MNGFLVLVRCGMDDLPARLCPTAEEARAVAEGLKPGDVEGVLRLLKLDTSVYIAIDVLGFRDGRLVSVEPVRDFDDEPDCEWLD